MTNGMLRRFVEDFATLLEHAEGEREIHAVGGDLLQQLLKTDTWLPDEFARSDPARYRQYLLHCDSLRRFSVVSFAWGPGQSTPIHDHTVWGLAGILRGIELEQRFSRSPTGELVKNGPPARLGPGEVAQLSPGSGDIHQVSNGSLEEPAISIHVYGADIGAVRRSVYTPNGLVRPFVSGYANDRLPNLWGQADDDGRSARG
jgi:predicted metal-dependent enzyme (double-stranded beta helix superfamily)